ncbi:unnamed protein product [Diamesa tonsa]
MASVLQNVYNSYNYYFYEYNDTRVQHLPLMDKPWLILQLITAYLLFVKVFGKKMMENRKPFNLTKIINIYNIAQILLNLFCLFISFKYSYMQKDYSWTCQPPPYNDYSPAGAKRLSMTYMYLILKIVDLMDTIFFILRKKYNQITFLHTYHHAGMVLGCYVFGKFFSGGGHTFPLAIINSFVHVLMYGYYFATSFKPELKNSMWWKKHITQIQMFQFTLLIIHFSIPLFKECSFPKIILLLLTLQNLFMLLMFGDFYYKAYIRKKSVKEVE